MRKQTISVDTAFSDARQWYHNTYMLTDTNSKTLQSIGTVKNDWSKVLTPYWDKGKAFKSKGLDFIELPALKKGDFAIAEQPVATGKFDFTKSNSITSLLIIKQNGIYGIYTMTILADSAYLKGNYASLNINTYRNRAKDFNGMVLYHKLDGAYVNGWRYVNGKVTTALYERKTNGTNQSIQSVNQQKTNTLSCQAVRVTTYWQDCAYYNDDLTYSHPFDCHYYTTETTVTACAENGSSGGGGASPGCPVTPPPGGGGQNPDNVNDAGKNVMVTDPNPAQPVDPGGGIIPPPPAGSGCQVVLPVDTVTISVPCAQAKALSKNDNFRQLMGLVQQHVASNNEIGYTYTMNNSGAIQAHDFYGEPGGSSVTITTPDPIDGFVHSHYAGDFPTFSGDDIKQVYDIMRTGHMQNPQSFTAGVVTASGTQYLIKISDPTKFSAFGANNFSTINYENFLNKYSLLVAIYQSSNDHIATFELSLLSVLKDSGLTVFKGNSSFNSWEPIKNSNNKIIITNCN